MVSELKSKASRAEVAARVAEVLRIRLDGAAFHQVVEFSMASGWNVSERQCGRYLEKADELLAARQTKNRSRIINLHTARCEALFARAVDGADYRTALAVLSEMAKVQRLYEPERTNGSADGSRLTLEEAKEAARQAIAELPKPLTESPDLPPPPEDDA